MKTRAASTPTVEIWGIKQCGSTRKAMKLLEKTRIPYTFRDLREEQVPKTLLRDALRGMTSFRKAFNTSGASYKDGGWKNKVESLSRDDVLSALLADPMLIKRPLVHGAAGVAVGYDEEAIRDVLK